MSWKYQLNSWIPKVQFFSWNDLVEKHSKAVGTMTYFSWSGPPIKEISNMSWTRGNYWQESQKQVSDSSVSQISGVEVLWKMVCKNNHRLWWQLRLNFFVGFGKSYKNKFKLCILALLCKNCVKTLAVKYWGNCK